MKIPKAITALEAWKLLQSSRDICLVDVRSDVEYTFVGHPLEAELIPWMEEPDWEINPDFAEDVKCAVMPKHCTEIDDDSFPDIILICRSGNRSLAAGKVLLNAGFKNVMHIDEGFEGDLNGKHQRNSVNGWRFRGLPWKQC